MSSVIAALGRGVLGAAELRTRLGISPATLMRAVRDAGPGVVAIGRARATRYGLRQPWPQLAGSRFPLFRVGDDGTVRSVGELETLAARQSAWLPQGQVYEGLPADVSDARPAGFLGRHFVASHGDLRLPPRLDEWSDHHILLALSRRGEDLPGNLIVGDESFARWQALDPVVCSRDDYPSLAEAAMAGRPPEALLGGSRPKFCAFVEGRHRLVKFVARGRANDAVARRWCDLLELESLASEVVRAAGIPAATATLIEAPAHLFLESDRFDRIDGRGRLAVVSLAAVHDDPADPWARAAVRLEHAGRLTAEDARRLRWLDAFGALIGNTERHQRNVLFFGGEGGLRLAPAFDQVPMLYAPSADGQVLDPRFDVPPMTADTMEVWGEARQVACTFWDRASRDRWISQPFRAIAAANLKTLTHAG